ncbi:MULTISPECIES: type II secretion system F family protein [unclassified Brevibacterium]|uniref:type II secretion system F family protein n=1 Tax=unclassified Brevibacterium TaxID=2614124 RepID=UPI001E2BE96F|nr:MULTISPECIES: type II secretion system F family protein [unclassified Brevibacterium]MCD1285690.1 type II secretion system protein [Brevibacterium sp. CCUG 69071]MDK8434749.1 type II secretion system F family protein [Brevibacterium sp. H-BE7]
MSVLTDPLTVILLGLFNGFALCVLVLSLPPLRRPSLSSRIAPYLRDQESLIDIYAPPTPRSEGAWSLLRSMAVSAALWVTSRITTDATLSLRINRLGGNASIERFRINQVLSILVGMIAAGLVAGLLSAQRGFSPIVTVILIVSGGIAGHIINDWRLSQAINRHESRVLAEFPTVAELLALSITAGEGIVEALERVCRTCSGDLVDELRAALAATRTGTPLVEALDGMATRIAIPEIVQFVDGLAVSMTRGTPLAEVLRAQAADVREQSRRRLLELSGKKEIGMLVPVVVFVLPVTVIFAVFPSLTVLDLGP